MLLVNFAGRLCIDWKPITAGSHMTQLHFVADPDETLMAFYRFYKWSLNFWVHKTRYLGSLVELALGSKHAEGLGT